MPKINAYLVNGPEILIGSRQHPLANKLEMNFGNMPADGGNLLISADEYEKLSIEESAALKFIKPMLSAHEFLNGKKRYCIWLTDENPSEWRKAKYIYNRVQENKVVRENSSRPWLAEIPYLFAQITQPSGKDFLLIPRHSSENREYIPMGLFNSEYIAHDSCLILPEAEPFQFGIMSSKMHMAWVRYTCGRLESRYRYSKDIVYNNYPWPNDPSPKNKKKVEEAAQQVLDVRERYPDSSLADLYDPLTMPPDLVKAHQALDKAVDLCYRPQPFPNETTRIEYLFNLYQEYTAPLMGNPKKSKTKSNGKSKV